MGILLMVFALQEANILSQMALFLEENLPSTNAMIVAIGVLSSIVDNGSLVAATQGMFSLADFPMDHSLWEFIALCAGTGGSMLIIGSAAGVAIMEKEKNYFYVVFKENHTFSCSRLYCRNCNLFVNWNTNSLKLLL
ncbi:MAG: hypothetical protein LRY25_02750 [Flavobacterium sp.]|nr:hypothetical protein [Flavobacterium sp.]